jgi:hypothetical protein
MVPPKTTKNSILDGVSHILTPNKPMSNIRNDTLDEFKLGSNLAIMNSSIPIQPKMINNCRPGQLGNNFL